MNKHYQTIWKITLLFAIIGFVDSVYLLIIKLTHNPLLCIEGIGDCWTVNTSRYSEVFGIPLGLLGVLGYLLISVLLFIIRYNTALKRGARYSLFGVSLVGFIYSIYLTYIEIYILKAVCPFCILSAIMMTLIFTTSIINLNTKNPYL
jgi:uncharacterized membrane protein